MHFEHRNFNASIGKNQGEIYLGDNLLVMRDLSDQCIDLICTNPPLFKLSNRPIPSHYTTNQHGFSATWNQMTIPPTWNDQIEFEHPELAGILSILGKSSSKSLYNYLQYLTIRLIEMKRVLKETGSIFLHCGPSFSHYVRLCMDHVFGFDQFRNEIVYCYYGRGTTKRQKSFQQKHEILLFYSRSDGYIFHQNKALRFANSERINPDNYPVQVPLDFDLHSKHRMVVLEDWWKISPPRGSEVTSYPNQKPCDLYRRIIEVTTDLGDLVLDPFCGSGAVCIESARLKRKWIGIDITTEAARILQDRLQNEAGLGRLSEVMSGTKEYVLIKLDA